MGKPKSQTPRPSLTPRSPRNHKIYARNSQCESHALTRHRAPRPRSLPRSAYLITFFPSFFFFEKITKARVAEALGKSRPFPRAPRSATLPGDLKATQPPVAPTADSSLHRLHLRAGAPRTRWSRPLLNLEPRPRTTPTLPYSLPPRLPPNLWTPGGLLHAKTFPSDSPKSSSPSKGRPISRFPNRSIHLSISATMSK